MSDGSTIEWLKRPGTKPASWNPTRGCTRISTGCGGPKHEGGCYAEKIAARFSDPGHPFHGFAERTPHGGRWTGKLALIEVKLTEPLHWRDPRTIFVNSMSDLFHENLADGDIDKVFAVMALTPQHTHLVLTKRSDRMRAYFDKGYSLMGTPKRAMAVEDAMDEFTAGKVGGGPDMPVWPLPNVWLGISAERQEEADERIPHLLATPAAVRFVSAEPLLGRIDLHPTWLPCRACKGRGYYLPNFSANYFVPCEECIKWARAGGLTILPGQQATPGPRLDWIIVGGESGSNARPMHPDWTRSIRDQCAAAGVAFFFKQWGGWCDTHPDWPIAKAHAVANDGTAYLVSDLAYPDGPRRAEALRKGHDHANLTSMYRVGKKAAGRSLDGREHSEFPEVRT